MGRTVSELSASMTTEELTDWYAFDRISPVGFGFAEADLLLAALKLHICDVAGSKKRSGRFSINDFKLFKPKDHRTPIEMMRSMFGNRIRKK